VISRSGVVKFHKLLYPYLYLYLYHCTSFPTYDSFVVADLYDAWLAPHFAASMDAETWLNGGEPLASNCSGKYHVGFLVLLQKLCGFSQLNTHVSVIN